MGTLLRYSPDAAVRLAYVFFVSFVFVASLPLQALAASAVVLTSGFPVLFRQTRIGKNGRPFVMYKFRTMIHGAQRLKGRYSAMNESDGPTFKIRHDPRFTPLGKFLSHTGLDELPQVWNVLRGEMALIGPRPLPVAEAKKLAPWMRARHRILPGIISPAILTGRYHNDFEAWMRSDVAYAETKHPLGDVRLFFQSMWFFIRLIARELLA